MITKSYKNFLAGLLACGSSGMMPVKSTNGVMFYAYGYMYSTSCFPNEYTFSVKYTNTEAGIILGNGTTAATEDDYTLAHQITTGLRTTVSRKWWVDNGVPKTEFIVTITNTDTVSQTISEIGMVQRLRCATTYEGTDSTSSYVLFDRTVLSTPVTIAPDGVAIIRYTLQTEVL